MVGWQAFNDELLTSENPYLFEEEPNNNALWREGWGAALSYFIEKELIKI